MVLPVGQSDDIQKIIKIKKNDDKLEYTELLEVRFVPLIEGEVKEKRNEKNNEPYKKI